MTCLPESFIRLLGSYGSPLLAGLPEALAQGNPQVSVRLNPAKAAPQIADGCTPVPWSDGNGFYLPERPVFTLDPALHQGRYYVQEASSMFHAHVVSSLVPDASDPLILVDACAAPGGKTTAAAVCLPEGSLVVANEYVPSRAAVLRENVIKWGIPAAVVTRGDTAAFREFGERADIIIADVPCSGEGMMRKDPDAVAQWSEGLVDECVSRQREIIANLWPALRPGGFLIYSTCTFNRRENEETIDWIASEFSGESVEVPGVDPQWGIAPGIDTPHHCYRFLPHRLRGEGLFVAVLRKPDGSAARATVKEKDKRRDRQDKNAVPASVKSWIKAGSELQWTVSPDGRINAFPAQWAPVLRQIERTGLSVIHHGVVAGHLKGRDVVPDQSLAMSALLNRDAFPSIEIDAATALAYLRSEAITLPAGTPRGQVLLSFEGEPLGFVKNLGSRANNLYPKDWRILLRQ